MHGRWRCTHRIVVLINIAGCHHVEALVDAHGKGGGVYLNTGIELHN
jgi:hypothetical protein